MICQPLGDIENSVTFAPHGQQSKSGAPFSLICHDGFSPSAANGSMICDENKRWQNQPKCIGQYEVWE